MTYLKVVVTYCGVYLQEKCRGGDRRATLSIIGSDAFIIQLRMAIGTNLFAYSIHSFFLPIHSLTPSYGSLHDLNKITH